MSAAGPPRTTALLVHGAGGGGWEFDVWRREFEERGWQVVARDLEPSLEGLAATKLRDYVSQVVAWGQDAAVAPHGELVLVGASMGGALVLSAAEQLRPTRVVLVNSVVPTPWARPTARTAKELPDVIRWAGSSLESTVRALPDATPEVQRWACARWRDESGAVMREIRAGFNAVQPRCPALFVISGADTDVPAEQQAKWARAWSAPTLEYDDMSHVGPLLGASAHAVAHDVEAWLVGTADDGLERNRG